MTKQFGKSKIIVGCTYDLKTLLPRDVVIVRAVRVSEDDEIQVGVSYMQANVPDGVLFTRDVSEWVSPCNLRSHNIW